MSAEDEQITGVSGSPSATTTIDDKELALAPEFGGRDQELMEPTRAVSSR